jgi:hypothetical protein
VAAHTVTPADSLALVDALSPAWTQSRSSSSTAAVSDQVDLEHTIIIDDASTDQVDLTDLATPSFPTTAHSVSPADSIALSDLVSPALFAATQGLYESLLRHDRPLGWWGLDTTGTTEDNSGNGYTLTAGGTPADAATIFSRGDGVTTGCRDFNGTTDYYYTEGTQYATADAPPNFVASATAESLTTGIAVAVPAVEAGDLLLVHLVNDTATATIASAPAGWTQVGTTLNATHVAAATYKRTPSADEAGTSYEWQWSVADDNLATLLVYRNADPDVSGLVYDSGRQATGPAGEHSTTTETHPEQTRAVMFWAGSGNAGIVPENPYSTLTQRASLVHTGGGASLVATDDVAEAAGSMTRAATTGENNARLAVTLVTFGAAQKVVNESLDALASNVSIHAVVRPDTVSGLDPIVSKVNTAGDTALWRILLNAGVLEFRYEDGGSTARTVSSGVTLSAATTYHLVVTDDGTNINFYVNGVKTSVARTGAAGYETSPGRLKIGNSFSAGGYFDGKIDEPAVLRYVTDDMVATWYEAYLSGTFGDGHVAGPRIKLEIAWASAPADVSYAWQDVTSFCQGAATSRGRSFELDRMETGRCDFELKNLGGEFQPENDESPYYPWVIPTRPVRLRAQAVVDGPAYPLFFGFTEGHPVIRPGHGHDSRARFTAADTMKALSLDKVLEQAVREPELAGARIQAVLEGIEGVPFDLDAGQSEVVGDDIKGLNRLDHVQVVSATDGGVVFADASGIVRFQDRHYRIKNESVVRFAYSTAEAATYRALHLELEVDEARLFTTAAITPASGSTKTAEDAEAVRQHYRRAKEVQTLHVNDNDAQAMAEGYVGRYSTPRILIPDFDVRPTDATGWTAVLSHELSHRISTFDLPLGVAAVSPALTREHFIERIEHSIATNDWRVKIGVSPAELESNYWILGVGRLGETEGRESTRLGW